MKVYTERTNPWLNNYVESILRVWRANIDCQFVGNPWGVAQYVAYYTSKHEPAVKSVNALRKAILKLTPGTSTHVVFRTLANANNASKTVSLQEAYWLIRNYTYAYMSRKVIRVNAVPKERRNTHFRSRRNQQPSNDSSIPSTDGPQSAAGQFINYSLRGDDLEDISLRDFLEQYAYSRRTSANAIPLRDQRGHIVRRKRKAIVSAYPDRSIDMEDEDCAYSLMLLDVPWRVEGE